MIRTTKVKDCIFKVSYPSKMKRISFVLFAAVLLVTSCREEYMPSIPSQETGLLVVEANLNPQGPAVVYLSRTARVNSPNALVPENGASVTIEGKDNSIQIVPETGNGNYILSNPLMAIGDEYRLRVETADGDKFLSAYVNAKRTPEIDSVSWLRTDDGVDVYVNTTASLNPTRYFRWNYVETWEIRSHFFSVYVYENGRVRPRVFPQEDVSVCWKTFPLRQILLGSSLRFQSGILRNVPLVIIPEGDEKLSVRYSIKATQWELEADAFRFYEILRTNSQDLGTHFGPMPSELKGNIQCLNKPGWPVVGFVTASSIAEKRIFIDRSQIANWNNDVRCPEIRVAKNNTRGIDSVISGGVVPFTLDYFQNEEYYIFSTPYCVDCVSRGGSTVKPPFW
jgi:hypothetical protein